MVHALSLSYGKDSLACLGAIEELGWPLDRIIHAEIWATDTIPADLPPMVDFKEKADEIIYKRYGIKVEHVSSGKTYEDIFYRVRSERSKYKGMIYGWPGLLSNWCNGELKVSALKKAQSNVDIIYIGIAVDEPNRFHNITDKKKSPLIEAKWTEQMCKEWCEKNDLLSPIYTDSKRGGCWFCNYQNLNSLRNLRNKYPEYYKLMLKWDNDAPKHVCFKGNKRLIDYEKRFQLEDLGLIKQEEPFYWKMLEDENLNYRLF